jgi:Arc/MetJ-type ribon-helix-helix transcriptional regulator
MLPLVKRSEQLIGRQLRAGRYRSAEDVVAHALEALEERELAHAEGGEWSRAVADMLQFAEKHRFTLGEGVRIKDLLHEGHKY